MLIVISVFLINGIKSLCFHDKSFETHKVIILISCVFNYSHVQRQVSLTTLANKMHTRCMCKRKIKAKANLLILKYLRNSG